MNEITAARLTRQQLVQPQFKTPRALVAWFGAVQAQDYPGALWALGQRIPGSAVADIEAAIADRSVARTNFMRGTQHFMAGEDMRWMVKLMGERVIKIVNNINRASKINFTEADFMRARDVIIKTLEGGKQLIRSEINAALIEAGFPKHTLANSFLMQRAQADGICCNGVYRGKWQTFTLLAEWLPEAKTLDRDAALAEFTRRYFQSHGPATDRDYAWWSGLTLTECRAGIESIRGELASESIGGETYWYAANARPVPQEIEPRAHLLPNYDEYTVGYKDRSAAFDPAENAKLEYVDGIVFNHTVVIGGRVAATWKRSFKNNQAIVALKPVIEMRESDHRLTAEAVRQYGEFLGMEGVVTC